MKCWGQAETYAVSPDAATTSVDATTSIRRLLGSGFGTPTPAGQLDGSSGEIEGILDTLPESLLATETTPVGDADLDDDLLRTITPQYEPLYGYAVLAKDVAAEVQAMADGRRPSMDWNGRWLSRNMATGEWYHARKPQSADDLGNVDSVSPAETLEAYFNRPRTTQPRGHRNYDLEWDPESHSTGDLSPCRWGQWTRRTQRVRARDPPSVDYFDLDESTAHAVEALRQTVESDPQNTLGKNRECGVLDMDADNAQRCRSAPLEPVSESAYPHITESAASVEPKRLARCHTCHPLMWPVNEVVPASNDNPYNLDEPIQIRAGTAPLLNSSSCPASPRIAMNHNAVNGERPTSAPAKIVLRMCEVPLQGELDRKMETKTTSGDVVSGLPKPIPPFPCADNREPPTSLDSTGKEEAVSTCVIVETLAGLSTGEMTSNNMPETGDTRANLYSISRAISVVMGRQRASKGFLHDSLRPIVSAPPECNTDLDAGSHWGSKNWTVVKCTDRPSKWSCPSIGERSQPDEMSRVHNCASPPKQLAQAAGDCTKSHFLDIMNDFPLPIGAGSPVASAWFADVEQSLIEERGDRHDHHHCKGTSVPASNIDSSSLQSQQLLPQMFPPNHYTEAIVGLEGPVGRKGVTYIVIARSTDERFGLSFRGRLKRRLTRFPLSRRDLTHKEDEALAWIIAEHRHWMLPGHRVWIVSREEHVPRGNCTVFIRPHSKETGFRRSTTWILRRRPTTTLPEYIDELNMDYGLKLTLKRAPYFSSW